MICGGGECLCIVFNSSVNASSNRGGDHMSKKTAAEHAKDIRNNARKYGMPLKSKPKSKDK